MTVEKQTVAALKWTGIAKFGGQAISWAITFVVLRLLAPSDYGLMAIVSVIMSILTNIADLGLGASIVQTLNLDRRELAKLNGAVVILNVAMGALLAACAPLAAMAFHDDRLTDLIRVASLQFVFIAAATIPQSIAYRNMDFKWLARIELSSIVLSGLLTLALAWYGAGAWALVIGGLVASAVRAALLLTQGFIYPVFASEGLKRHLTFGGTVMVSRLLWQVVYQMDTLIAGRYLSQAALGLYSVSLHAATLPMQKIMGIINQVAFPAVAKLQSDLPRLRKRLLEASRIMSVLSLSVMWGLSCVAPEFVSVILGPKWKDAVYPLQVICLVVPLRMLNSIYATAAMAVGRAVLDMRNNVVSAIVLPAGFFIGVHWGITGLASSWLVSIPLVFIINFPRITGALGIPASEVIVKTRGPVIAAIAMYAAVYGVRLLLASISDLARLPILIVVGVATYVGVVLLVDAQIRPEVRRFVESLRA